MRDFLLDTQMITYWYDVDREQHPNVEANISELIRLSSGLENKPKLLVSVISLGEIEFGHRVQPPGRTSHSEARWRFIREKFPEPLDVSQDAVAAYGELRMRLFDDCAPGNMRHRGMRPEQLTDPTTSLALKIQENDLWLCAQAVGHQMVFVTNDHMDAIRKAAVGMDPELIIQNWAEPNTARIIE